MLNPRSILLVLATLAVAAPMWADEIEVAEPMAIMPAPPVQQPVPPAKKEKTPLPAPAAVVPMKAGEIRLHLTDGSVITGAVQPNVLDVTTQFGALKVPVDSIRTITPGLDSHPELKKKIADMINDLGAEGFAERETATAGLLKIGPIVRGELDKAVKNSDGEKQARLQRIIEEFDELTADDEETAPELIAADTIVTTNFTIVGKINTAKFDVTSAYGPLSIKLGDIKRAERDIPQAEETKKTVTVTGTVIQTRTFEASGVKVNKGDQVFITASGSITMTPWGGNQSSSPDGGMNFGSYQPGNIPGGALIARVGTNGNIFKAGSKHTFIADKTGVLHFSIAMPGDYSSYQFPGEYNVKVRVVRK